MSLFIFKTINEKIYKHMHIYTHMKYSKALVFVQVSRLWVNLSVIYTCICIYVCAYICLYM